MKLEEKLLGLQAEKPNITFKKANQLANCSYESVKIKIAQNPTTPPEVLEKLMHEKQDIIKFAVIVHQHTTPQMLHQLAENCNFLVGELIAIDNKLQLDTIEMLLSHPYADVRRMVVKNPQITDELVFKVAEKDEHISVRQKAVETLQQRHLVDDLPKERLEEKYNIKLSKPFHL